MLFDLLALKAASLTQFVLFSVFLLKNPAAVSQENPRPADVTPAKKKKKEVSAGQIEK